MTEQMAPILELTDIGMEFGPVEVLRGVGLRVDPGEVVGLVGDNGAGKSTLVKIITGYHRPTSGQVRLNGQLTHFNSPAEARALGIETVYQDLALIGELALWRNFFLGKEIERSFGPMRVLDIGAMKAACVSALSGIGLTRIRSADSLASFLSGGERQSVAITRSLHFGAQLLLLDEPTAALSVRETERVLRTIRTVADKGMAIVYIDHNMAHVHPVADRIVVLEHGRVVAEFAKGEGSIEELKAIVGRNLANAEGDAE